MYNQTEEKNKKNIANLMDYISYRRKRQKTLHRSTKKVMEYILSNDFDLYVTITFDPRRLRNYKPQAALSRLNGWLSRQRTKSRTAGKELRYITFPEVYHDKNLLEFHILMSGWQFSLIRSGVVIDGSLALTIKAFHYGYTKARSLKDSSKQQIFDLVLPHLVRNSVNFFNGRSYFPSKNLEIIELIENANTRMAVASELDPINSLEAYDNNAILALGVDSDWKPIKGHKRLAED